MATTITTDLSYQQQPTNRNLDSLPGTGGIPWVGETYQLVQDFYGLMDKHYKKYGPVSHIKIVGHSTLLCIGVEANKMILLDTEKNFSATMAYKDNLGHFYDGSLLTRDFEDHRLHRRIFRTAFKSESLKHYVELINPLFEANITSWQKDKNFLFFPNIKLTLLDIAASVFLGIEDFKGAEAQRISQTFIEIVEAMMTLIHIDSPLLPFLKWRKGKQGMRYMNSYLFNLIPARRASNRKDIFTLFTQEKDQEGHYFSDADISAHINLLLFAAHDTTTSNLCYIMQYLGQDVAIQQKAREQSIALGKAFLDYEDLANMTDIENIHNEALRMHPPASMINRRTIRECVIEGVTIPPNTVVSIPPCYTHMMTEHWSQPEKFDPDRFSPERAEHKRHPYQFVAFGGGAHKCIGIHFAGMIVKTFMHQMLLNYEWTVPEGYHPKHQTVPLPKQKDNLPLILKRRL